MSAEAVGRHMPAVASLDDLTAMMAADRYQILATTPLSWVLNTAPGDHLG
jgi:hypothetical protein